MEGYHSRTLIRLSGAAMGRSLTRTRELRQLMYAEGVLTVNGVWAAWRTLLLLLSWCIALCLLVICLF